MTGVDLLDVLPHGILRVRVSSGDGSLKVEKNQLGYEVHADGRKVYYVDNSSRDSRFWADRLPGPPPAVPESAREALARLGDIGPLESASLESLAPLVRLFPPDVYFLRVNEFSVRETRDWLRIAKGVWHRILGHGPSKSKSGRHFETTRHPIHSDWILTPYLLTSEDPGAVDARAVAAWKEKIRKGERPAAFGPTLFFPKKALEGLNPMLVVSVAVWSSALVKAYADLEKPVRFLSVIQTDWTADYLAEVLARF